MHREERGPRDSQDTQELAARVTLAPRDLLGNPDRKGMLEDMGLPDRLE